MTDIPKPPPEQPEVTVTLTMSEARILLMSMLATMQGEMLDMEDPQRGVAGNSAAAKLNNKIWQSIQAMAKEGRC